MPWFWGKKQEEEEEEEEYTDSEYESDENSSGSDDSVDEAGSAQNGTADENVSVDAATKKIVNANDRDGFHPKTPMESITTDEGDDNHSEEDDDDISLIDDSSGVDSLSDDLFESSSEEEEEEEEEDEPHQQNASPAAPQQSTQSDDATTDDEDEVPTSFWEKQSLLILAAEHDRVDILKGILTDHDEDKERLMNSGIPPLHLSITFGSVNATVALLRMGADPSVRPNLHDIIEQQKEQPEDSKVEIPNIQRFDEASAWELAFGNKSYHDAQKYKKSKSWSLFGSSTSSLGDSDHHPPVKPSSSARIIKPVDMPPSKREGVRHAFTAEALRSVGGDEVDRLKQLVDSGMPAIIDIGGKDLYGWAVEMGALKCEELLRPAEAAKYGESDNDDAATSEGNDTIGATPSQNGKALDQRNSSFVVHRPSEETVPELKNRLDELESLSVALSSCLDNLAEEVSVCHGLLLMGGGATALASHVKSLKSLKDQKLVQLEEAQTECGKLGKEFMDLVYSSGEIGQEIAKTPAFKLFKNISLVDGDMSETSDHGDASEDDDIVRKSLMAQVAASENKIRKLRSSIADLSEENARDMQEVERRGLEGGINLVRGLREEIRDIDFHLGESRSAKTEYKTKISMIRARIPSQPQYSLQSIPKPPGKALIHKSPPLEIISTKTVTKNMPPDSIPTTISASNQATPGPEEEAKSMQNGQTEQRHIETQAPAVTVSDVLVSEQQKTPSEKIATGDSQALALIQPGNKGFFTVDLWQVILRIIGFERAAYRRGMEVASVHPNVMIV